MSASAPTPASFLAPSFSGQFSNFDRPSVAPSSKSAAVLPAAPIAEIVPANAGDHPEIHQLLTAVFQAPSRDVFLAGLDDPFYEPNDRLLVSRNGRTVAHLHVTQREMQFGSARFPVAGLSWLGVLPEFRSQSYGQKLLAAAHRKMASDGAVAGFLVTKIPHFFRPHGWAVCGRHSHATAGARDILAELSRRSEQLNARPLVTRPWRQVEMPHIMRIYEANTAKAAGPWVRSEAYWRWLVARYPSEQLLVAIDGPDKMELDDVNSPIVGYAIVRDDRVLEVMAQPGHPTAALHLLGRACREAIERDCHTVNIFAPPGSEMHTVCRSAGGLCQEHEADQGLVFMAKLLDPLAFLKGMRGVLRERVVAEGLPPCELGLIVDGDKYSVRVSKRGVVVGRNKTGRSYLNLNVAEFTRLLLGHLDLEPALAQGRVEASTRVAAETASVLFPRLPLWRSPLDDSLASG